MQLENCYLQAIVMNPELEVNATYQGVHDTTA